MKKSRQSSRAVRRILKLGCEVRYQIPDGGWLSIKANDTGWVVQHKKSGSTSFESRKKAIEFFVDTLYDFLQAALKPTAAITAAE